VALTPNRTILLIEDDPDDEALTLRALRQAKLNVRVTVVHDGAQALDRLLGRGAAGSGPERLLPDLILLDLKLPRLNGFDVLRRLRAEERTRTLPVVVLTSSDESRDIVQSYRLGANSYVRKPVEAEAFLAAVQSIGAYWLTLNAFTMETL
jgi:two-component system response regulator